LASGISTRQEADRRGRLQGREDRHARRRGYAQPACLCIALRRPLEKLELNVEIAASDWGNLVIRRASKKPVAEGGWSIFGTGWVGADMLDPSLNQALRTNGEAAWFGWPSDDRLEELRAQWLKASDSEARQEIATAIQLRAFETVPYIPTGAWKTKTAYRKNLKVSSSRSGNLPVERREGLGAVTRSARSRPGFAMLQPVNS
jgi:hypothetical protein